MIAKNYELIFDLIVRHFCFMTRLINGSAYFICPFAMLKHHFILNRCFFYLHLNYCFEMFQRLVLRICLSDWKLALLAQSLLELKFIELTDLACLLECSGHASS